MATETDNGAKHASVSHKNRVHVSDHCRLETTNGRRLCLCKPCLSRRSFPIMPAHHLSPSCLAMITFVSQMPAHLFVLTHLICPGLCCPRVCCDRPALSFLFPMLHRVICLLHPGANDLSCWSVVKTTHSLTCSPCWLAFCHATNKWILMMDPTHYPQWLSHSSHPLSPTQATSPSRLIPCNRQSPILIHLIDDGHFLPSLCQTSSVFLVPHATPSYLSTASWR